MLRLALRMLVRRMDREQCVGSGLEELPHARQPWPATEVSQDLLFEQCFPLSNLAGEGPLLHPSCISATSLSLNSDSPAASWTRRSLGYQPLHASCPQHVHKQEMRDGCGQVADGIEVA